MGECAYAAVSDQLLGVRGRPGRLRGVGVFGAAVVLDPLRNQPCPKPACFASVDRRSLYPGAVIGCSRGRLQRSNFGYLLRKSDVSNNVGNEEGKSVLFNHNWSSSCCQLAHSQRR